MQFYGCFMITHLPRDQIKTCLNYKKIVWDIFAFSQRLMEDGCFTMTPWFSELWVGMGLSTDPCQILEPMSMTRAQFEECVSVFLINNI